MCGIYYTNRKAFKSLRSMSIIEVNELVSFNVDQFNELPNLKRVRTSIFRSENFDERMKKVRKLKPALIIDSYCSIHQFLGQFKLFIKRNPKKLISCKCKRIIMAKDLKIIDDCCIQEVHIACKNCFVCSDCRCEMINFKKCSNSTYCRYIKSRTFSLIPHLCYNCIYPCGCYDYRNPNQMNMFNICNKSREGLCKYCADFYRNGCDSCFEKRRDLCEKDLDNFCRDCIIKRIEPIF